MSNKIKTVADLPSGYFHLAVVQTGNTAVPILDGEVTTLKKKRQMKDLTNSGVYETDTIVLLFQKSEESEIFK